MNQITIIGTVSKDPTTSTTQGGHTVTKFSVEVPKNMGKGKTFFRVTAWGKSSEAATGLYQGLRVAVAGEMQNNRYQPNGSEEWRDSWEVNASAIERLDGNAAEQHAPAPAAAPQPAAPPAARPPAPPVVPTPAADVIPF